MFFVEGKSIKGNDNNIYITTKILDFYHYIFTCEKQVLKQDLVHPYTPIPKMITTNEFVCLSVLLQSSELQSTASYVGKMPKQNQIQASWLNMFGACSICIGKSGF